VAVDLAQAEELEKHAMFDATSESLSPSDREALRKEVATGLEQARRGELIPGNEVLEKLRRKSRSRSRAASDPLADVE
jgi:predicted transcriptional regulator